LKNQHTNGHREDENKDGAGEENRTGAIQIWFHFSKLTRPRLVPELSTPQKERVSTELYPQPALRLGAQRDSQHSTINSVKERGLPRSFTRFFHRRPAVQAKTKSAGASKTRRPITTNN